MLPPRLSRSSQIELIASDIEKPSVDDRLYRIIRLPNQLEVLLVQDAETDKASAAMDVNVGAFSDLEDMPGIAHAVEHALFMGTKKYPVENDYSSYLSAHSGYSNAYTSSTSTNYYFEVAAKSDNEGVSPFYGALDRFAQFFIEPLFLAETLDRELQAVDSENKKNLQQDMWRLHQLNKHLSNPNHPYCHFSTGNLETLKLGPEARGVNVRQEFINFHARHYSANRMKLVVLGRESLDTLEEWAEELFSGVPNKNLAQNRWENEAPLRDTELLTQYFAKPVMDSRTVTLFFPFPDEEYLYASKPSNYISHLIGHEGPGSIMACLKSRGWANGLGSYASSVAPGTPGIFQCEIQLTEQGLQNYREVVKVVFQYIALIKDGPPQEWIFEEAKKMASVDFKFKQKTPASSFASGTSSTMHKPIPREWLLSNSVIVREYNPEAITKGLNCLNSENFRMSIVSQTFPGTWDQKEKWYGTEYKYEKIPQDFLDEIKAASSLSPEQRYKELHIPHQNQFIPEKLDVEKKETKNPAIAPKIIRNDDLVRAWYKKDDTFWVPKANLWVDLITPLSTATINNHVKTKLYTELVKDALEEYAYDAELAGLLYMVNHNTHGLQLQVAGYNDKQAVLLEKILVTMRDLIIAEDRFAILKERLTRSLKNWVFGQPYQQIGEHVVGLVSQVGPFERHDQLAELENISSQDVQAFFPHLFHQIFTQTFIHGNVYKEDALRVTHLIEATLKPRILPMITRPTRRAYIIPSGSNFRYERTHGDPSNVNHCINYSLFLGDAADRRLKAKCLMLEQITHEPAFNQLRSKEQLGYVVFSGSQRHDTRLAYYILIQSERTPEYLESRIDAFLLDFATVLANMSDAEFDGHKRAICNKRMEKLKNLNSETSRLYQHIVFEYYDFDSVKLDVAEIQTITKQEMIEFFQRNINPSSSMRAKAVVYIHATGVSRSNEKPVPELEEKVNGSAANGGTIADTGFIASTTEKASELLSEGVKALGLSSATDGSESKDTPLVPVVVIDDLRKFKSTLQLSAGAQPVNDISQYIESNLKL